MSISLVAISKNRKQQQEFIFLKEELINAIKSQEITLVKLLTCIDPYDNTFFNRRQLAQIQREIIFLKQQLPNLLKDLNSLEYAVTQTLETPYFDYLVFVGD